MKNEEPTILTRSLTTGYTSGRNRITVTRDLNSCLQPGDLICLLGPNGAGKSTLLRTLAGFQPPMEGEILIMGKPLHYHTPRQLAQLLSVVLTEKPLLENMDVESLVGLGRTPYTNFWGRLCQTDKEAIDKAIRLTGIETLRNRSVPDLSDGERQKVMIAKALAQETPIIFLDEPTAFLDYPSKVEIMLLLRDLAHAHNKTIFLSTHDMEIALQTSDKIWLMDKELGITIGTREDLVLSGALERYFSRPGIIFDPETGFFRISAISSQNI